MRLVKGDYVKLFSFLFCFVFGELINMESKLIEIQFKINKKIIILVFIMFNVVF